MSRVFKHRIPGRSKNLMTVAVDDLITVAVEDLMAVAAFAPGVDNCCIG
jgi:hypothetical protein